MMLKGIAPLGTETILPAFVIGYRLPNGPWSLSVQTVAQSRAIPDWLIVLEQQAGGYCMSYPDVIGTVLRLEANMDKGSERMANMITGFKHMAEDPNREALEQDYPVLRRLVCTVGNPYSTEELLSLQNYVRQFIRIPTMSKGIEAFIEFEQCDPLDFFLGWHVMRCDIKPPEETEIRPYTLKSDYYWVDDFNFGAFETIDDVLFSEKLLHQIQDIGQWLNIHKPPHIFFLWENSD